MPVSYHRFVLRPLFGPVEVLRALEKIKGHRSQEGDGVDFEFDWIARRLEFSADSQEGVEKAVEHFRGQIAKLFRRAKSGVSEPEETEGDELPKAEESFGGLSDLFLIGKTIERQVGDESAQQTRFVVPIGVTLQDAATFGEMIGRSLVDVGVRGVQVMDRMEDCVVSVQLGPFTGNIDFASFINEFPLPEYMILKDMGIQELSDEELKAIRRAKNDARKARQKKARAKGKFKKKKK